MEKEKAAGVFGPYGAVVNEKTLADHHYHAAVTQRNLDIYPWEPLAFGAALAIEKIARAYRLSVPLAKVVSELSGLGGHRK